MKKNEVKNLNILLNDALQFHKKNNFSDAVKIYEQILLIDPNYFEANFFLGTLKAQTKKFEEASNLINKAIKIKPDLPDLHNNLGLIYRELGKFENSLESFKKAINKNPKFAIAYNNIGIVYRDLKKNEEAEKNFKYSIKLDPNNTDPYNNLGLIYIDLKKFNKAKECFMRCIEINPNNFQSLNNIGNLYKNSGEINTAEEYYIRALDANEKYFDTYNNLMVLYERTNQDKKFFDIIEKTKKKFQDNDIVKLFYGHYLYKSKKFSETIKILNEISFSEKQLNRERLRCLILAKSYDKQKEFGKAFKYFTKTNEINFSKKNININKNKFLNIINDRINFFSKEDTHAWSKNNFLDEKKPIFMIGFPRSGTTLLDTILRSHESVSVIEEKPMITELMTLLYSLINQKFTNLKNLDQKQNITLQEEYYKNLHKNIEHDDLLAKVLIDKMPLNIVHVGEILRIFPEAKFILSIRHPCDSVLSCFMQSFELNDSMANFLDLNDAAIMYDNVMKLWIQYTKLFSINFHVVKYENLINNFDRTITNILGFLELPWSQNVKNFYKTAEKRNLITTPSYDQVNQPIYKESLQRWKNYEEQISKILPILKPWIKEFGY